MLKPEEQELIARIQNWISENPQEWKESLDFLETTKIKRFPIIVRTVIKLTDLKGWVKFDQWESQEEPPLTYRIRKVKIIPVSLQGCPGNLPTSIPAVTEYQFNRTRLYIRPLDGGGHRYHERVCEYEEQDCYL